MAPTKARTIALFDVDGTLTVPRKVRCRERVLLMHPWAAIGLRSNGYGEEEASTEQHWSNCAFFCCPSFPAPFLSNHHRRRPRTCSSSCRSSVRCVRDRHMGPRGPRLAVHDGVKKESPMHACAAAAAAAACIVCCRGQQLVLVADPLAHTSNAPITYTIAIAITHSTSRSASSAALTW